MPRSGGYGFDIWYFNVFHTPACTPRWLFPPSFRGHAHAVNVRMISWPIYKRRKSQLYFSYTNPFRGASPQSGKPRSPIVGVSSAWKLQYYAKHNHGFPFIILLPFFTASTARGASRFLISCPLCARAVYTCSICVVFASRWENPKDWFYTRGKSLAGLNLREIGQASRVYYWYLNGTTVETFSDEWWQATRMISNKCRLSDHAAFLQIRTEFQAGWLYTTRAHTMW